MSLETKYGAYIFVPIYATFLNRPRRAKIPVPHTPDNEKGLYKHVCRNFTVRQPVCSAVSTSAQNVLGNLTKLEIKN